MTTYTVHDAWALHEVGLEILRARTLFPGNDDMYAALVEEVGELANALLEHKRGKKPSHAVRTEAVQIASMAVDIVTRGDRSLELEPPPGTLAFATDRMLRRVAAHVDGLRSAFPGNVGALRRVVRYLGRLDSHIENVLSVRAAAPRSLISIESCEVTAAHLAAAALRVAIEGDSAFPYLMPAERAA